MRNKIKAIRTAKNISAAQIAKKCDTTPTQLYRLEKGERELSFEWAEKIAGALGVKPYELLDDDNWNPCLAAPDYETANAASFSNKTHIAAETQDSQYVTVPLYDLVAAAGPGYAISKPNAEVIKDLIFDMPYLRKLGSFKDTFGMFIYGDSMAPILPNGSLVLIDQSKRDLWQGKIYLVRISDMLYVKYVEKLPGKLLLKSANRYYSDIELSTEEIQPADFEILGQVIWYSCEG